VFMAYRSNIIYSANKSLLFLYRELTVINRCYRFTEPSIACEFLRLAMVINYYLSGAIRCAIAPYGPRSAH